MWPIMTHIKADVESKSSLRFLLFITVHFRTCYGIKIPTYGHIIDSDITLKFPLYSRTALLLCLCSDDQKDRINSMLGSFIHATGNIEDPHLSQPLNCLEVSSNIGCNTPLLIEHIPLTLIFYPESSSRFRTVYDCSNSHCQYLFTASTASVLGSRAAIHLFLPETMSQTHKNTNIPRFSPASESISAVATILSLPPPGPTTFDSFNITDGVITPAQPVTIFQISTEGVLTTIQTKTSVTVIATSLFRTSTTLIVHPSQTLLRESSIRSSPESSLVSTLTKNTSRLPLTTHSSSTVTKLSSNSSIYPTSTPSSNGAPTRQSSRPALTDIIAIALAPVACCLFMFLLYRWARERWSLSHSRIRERSNDPATNEVIVIPVDPHVPKAPLVNQGEFILPRGQIRPRSQREDGAAITYPSEPIRIQPAIHLSLSSLRNLETEQLDVVGNETTARLSSYHPNTPTTASVYSTQPPMYEELVSSNEVRLEGGPVTRGGTVHDP
ncbi:hypothetical protein QCA50_007194 [Cerrena zonata]|uniref:Uncharacterized protein n=1 Tax=Cerrena zonata TaxID=2478898 RepID=A0AAW0GCZ1_9APHY